MNLQEAVAPTVVPNEPTLSFARPPIPTMTRLAAPSMLPSFGFTAAQLAVLRQQIIVFRRMKNQDYAIGQEILDLTKPLPLTLPSDKARGITVNTVIWV